MSGGWVSGGSSTKILRVGVQVQTVFFQHKSFTGEQVFLLKVFLFTYHYSWVPNKHGAPNKHDGVAKIHLFNKHGGSN